MSNENASGEAVAVKAKVRIPIAVAGSARAAAPSAQPLAGIGEPLSAKLADKKLYISGQISCASSRVSLNRYEEYILRHGAQRAEAASEADIILVDTCAFSAEKEGMSLDMIEKSKESAKRDAKVIVTAAWPASARTRFATSTRPTSSRRRTSASWPTSFASTTRTTAT